MPDWSYHPLLRPIGLALHGDRTGEVALARLHTLGSSNLGRWAIRFMGHMSAPEALGFEKAGVRFAGPVMLDSTTDPRGIAFAALRSVRVRRHRGGSWARGQRQK